MEPACFTSHISHSSQASGVSIVPEGVVHGAPTALVPAVQRLSRQVLCLATYLKPCSSAECVPRTPSAAWRQVAQAPAFRDSSSRSPRKLRVMESQGAMMGAPPGKKDEAHTEKGRFGLSLLARSTLFPAARRRKRRRGAAKACFVPALQCLQQNPL